MMLHPLTNLSHRVEERLEYLSRKGQRLINQINSALNAGVILAERVHITAWTALSVLTKAYLFLYLLPNVAALSFTLGFIFPEKVKKIENDVNMVFDGCRSGWEKCVLGGAALLVAGHNLGAILFLSTCYHSAKLGSHLYYTSKERYHFYNPG